MKNVAWWFRIVGAWYLFLALMNLFMIFVADASVIGGQLPYVADEVAVRTWVDGWSPFVLEMIGIGTFALWASRAPGRSLSALWLLVWLEFMHGVLDDLFLIARGYAVAPYIGFIVVHLIIIASGAWVARQSQAEAVSAGLAMAK